ncbi:hypothetical protein O6H91_06G039400 [Diphasiastrum complanatum]|uniref:Uncharacterized protein n=1 Tax=Diphasiastrum complanatum TaxID=34168 RepID=A0ACC2DCH4_DIPCM|nr:hypothetical protein O6H91_06G039400 [Diphasiastrum complanatum]
MTDLPNYQSPLQQEQHQHYLGQLDNNQPVMDELLLEQIFSLPAWSDVGGGLGKVPLDYHASGSEANPGLELSGAHKLYTMSLLPSVLPPGAFSEQGLGSQEREKEEIVENLHLRGSTQYCNGDRDFVSRIQRQHEIQVSKHSPVGRPVGSLSFNDSRTLNLVSRTIGSSQGGSGVHPVSPLPPLRLMNSGTGSLLFRSSSSMVSNGSPLPVLTPGSSNLQSPAMLSHSPSGRSSGSEGSAGARDCQSPPPLAPTFHQSYVGGTSPLPFALGQSKTETLLVTGEVSSGEAQFLGKRSRNEEALLKEPISNQGRDGLFNTLAGGQVGLPHLGRTNGQPLSQENLPAIQGVVSPSYGNGAAAAQAQSSGQAVPATAIINGVRPRVRARRGQATDPHSIAERLRRERIAERMKSLQELVPNSNKVSLDKGLRLFKVFDFCHVLIFDWSQSRGSTCVREINSI